MMKKREMAWRVVGSVAFAAVLLASASCKKNSGPPNHGFPEGSEVNGWVRTGEIRTFAAEQLSDYIDGDAEKYLQAGVKSTSTADYKAKDQTQVVADIYAMSSATGAQKIFESEPAGTAKNAGVGEASRLFKQSLTFRKGEYLVRIVAYQEAPQLEQEMVELGRAIERKLAH
jgi:hypothetical protein